MTLLATEWSLLQRARYSALAMGKKIPPGDRRCSLS